MNDLTTDPGRNWCFEPIGVDESQALDALVRSFFAGFRPESRMGEQCAVRMTRATLVRLMCGYTAWHQVRQAAMAKEGQ